MRPCDTAWLLRVKRLPATTLGRRSPHKSSTSITGPSSPPPLIDWLARSDGQRRVISELIGARIRNSTLRLGEALARWGLTPNLLTAVGLVLNLLVAAVIASGGLRAARSCCLQAVSTCSTAQLRGYRHGNEVRGFLDSTIDRYSESLVYGGVLVYLLGTGLPPWLAIDHRRHGGVAAHQLCASPSRGRRLQGFSRSPGAARTCAHPRRWTAHGICHPGAVDSGYRHPPHGRNPHGPRLAAFADDRAARGLTHGCTRWCRRRLPGDRDEATEDDFDADSMLSSPADIESAGRSCTAILVLRP